MLTGARCSCASSAPRSGGPRKCVGDQFALMEAVVALAVRRAGCWQGWRTVDWAHSALRRTCTLAAACTQHVKHRILHQS